MKRTAGQTPKTTDKQVNHTISERLYALIYVQHILHTRNLATYSITWNFFIMYNIIGTIFTITKLEHRSALQHEKRLNYKEAKRKK